MSPVRWLLGDPRWSRVLGKAGQQSWGQQNMSRGAERRSSGWLQASWRWGQSLKKHHQRVCRHCRSCATVPRVLLHCQDSPHAVAEAGQSFPRRKTRMWLLPGGSAAAEAFPGVCPCSTGQAMVLAGLQHIGFARHSAHTQVLETQIASEQAEGRAVLP